MEFLDKKDYEDDERMDDLMAEFKSTEEGNRLLKKWLETDSAEDEYAYDEALYDFMVKKGFYKPRLTEKEAEEYFKNRKTIQEIAEEYNKKQKEEAEKEKYKMKDIHFANVGTMHIKEPIKKYA